jgi:exodeoxyribonuclease V beta subunit
MISSGAASTEASAGPPRHPFEPNRFPLTPGLRLLEASAGTGKTFALAHLVLRLVAEAGLSLSRILVVSFTEATAAELRDRIGRRLQQGLTALEQPEGQAPDGVLEDWLAQWRGADEAKQNLLRGRLLLALEELDAADVTTIHGFCRRSLRRSALEAGRSPELALESDGDALIAEVVHDYGHAQLLPLPAPLLAGLRSRGVRPEAMAGVLRKLDSDPALQLDPPPDLPAWDEPLPAWLPQLWRKRWQLFRQLWAEGGRDLHECLKEEAARWRQHSHSKTGKYSPKPRSDRCALLDAWIASQPEEGSYEAVQRQELLREFFHPGGFSKVARALEQPADGEVRLPRPELMGAIADLVDGPAELVLLHAAHHGRRELSSRRQRSGVTTFSQLLADLDPGPDEQGAAELLKALGERYDAALVDEFQDTDPIQWRILRSAFGGGRQPLVIVGDPKQAIYRFRGGDLATYLRAAAEATTIYELNENRRSTDALIEGLNGLMAPGLRRSRLKVAPVLACADRSGPAPPQRPIELLWLGEEGETKAPSRTALEERLIARIAAYALELLERGLELGQGGRRRPLSPDDLCLLVLNHRQAEALRAALERQGLASRLVSRADVFASPAATALQRLLDALADPADANRLRLLAASPLLGWDGARLASDDGRDASRLAGRLARLAGQLPQRGLLAVLADLVDSERMASLAVGGRLLADLQQVTGLVQERLHADQLGPEAAADWLRRLRLDPDRSVPEEHQAHSDRADGAISVVTIHRSKGLEYPVVICPYLWSSASGGGRGGGRGIGRRWQPAGTAAPRLDLHLNEHWGAGQRARRDQRREEECERERLAYVAATRACHLLVLAWGVAVGQQASPLVSWLFDDLPTPGLDEDPFAARPPQHWREQLSGRIAARSLPIELRDAPAPHDRRWRPAPVGNPIPLACGPVPRFSDLDLLWGRSSYSSWTQAAHADGGSSGVASAALDEGRDTLDPADEEREQQRPVDGQAGRPEDGGQSPLAGFARGAAAGECLHRILERIELQEPLEAAGNREVVVRELRRAGLEEHWCEPVLQGLERMRLTPFGGDLGNLRVADLPPDGRLCEMGFDLCIDHVRAADLAAPFRQHPGGPFAAAYAEQLERLPIASRGFLSGSIDLVFREPGPDGSGRWWVLDWKSNWLGRRDAEGQPLTCGPRDYSQTAMAALMAARHYPLQAHLYLVALHRYLRWRLPGYAPEQHLGGYAYVFLRGTPGAVADGVPAGREAMVPGMLVERPPLERLLALDAALGGLSREVA